MIAALDGNPNFAELAKRKRNFLARAQGSATKWSPTRTTCPSPACGGGSGWGRGVSITSIPSLVAPPHRGGSSASSARCCSCYPLLPRAGEGRGGGAAFRSPPSHPWWRPPSQPSPASGGRSGLRPWREAAACGPAGAEAACGPAKKVGGARPGSAPPAREGGPTEMRMTPPIDRLPTARARGRRKVVSDSNYQHLPRVRGRVGVGARRFDHLHPILGGDPHRGGSSASSARCCSCYPLPRVRGRVGVGRGVSITSIPSLVATPIPAFPRKRGKG